jgi:glutaredoxin
MLTLTDMQQLAASKNIIFYKPGCPYCAATQELFEELVQKGLLPQYEIRFLGQDFMNETLTELVMGYGWKARYDGDVPTKPQIFINQRGKTEYFGGNDFFYASEWNLGEGNRGTLTLGAQTFDTPSKANPRG